MTSSDTNIWQSLSPLEDILAKIYTDANDSRRLAEYVGLPVNRIDFRATPINLWHSLLRLANMREVVEALLERCITDSESVELIKGYKIYRETVEAERQVQMAGSNNHEPAYAEEIRCKISLSDKLSMASHEYSFALRNFGRKLGEDKFQWLVPNATPDSVTSVAANFCGQTHTSISKDPLGRGTKLVFENLGTNEPGLTTLSFSYNAPTSAYFYSGKKINVCFYHAHLFHDFEITKLEEVIIDLPGEAEISMPDAIAMINGPTISYKEYNVLRGEFRVFPVFFCLRQPVRSRQLEGRRRTGTRKKMRTS